MEQKMITIPFDVELAKKIQAGEHPGKVVTRDNKDARIVCFDAFNACPLVVLIKSISSEYSAMYNEVGKSSWADETELPSDLVLQVPEWAQFKDGSVLITIKGSIFVLNRIEGYKVYGYVALTNGLGRTLSFGTDGRHYTEFGQIDGFATEEQKQQLIDALKKSTDPRAKECLKRFFGIDEAEEKPENEVKSKVESEFEPFQKVLVRLGDGFTWEASLFSHLCDKDEPYCTVGGIEYEQCIPYNDQTKHLLGTTDNWEE